ncbi:hypothetical protein D3C78_1356110 [compost metagenome]
MRLAGLLLLGIDQYVHVVAGQGKARDADHIVDAHRHGPLARGDDGRQPALGSLGGQLAFEHGFAAQHTDLDDAILQLQHIVESTFRNRAAGPVRGAQHGGQDLAAQRNVGDRNDDLFGVYAAPLRDPARRINRCRQADECRQDEQTQSFDVFHGNSLLSRCICYTQVNCRATRNAAVPRAMLTP